MRMALAADLARPAPGGTATAVPAEPRSLPTYFALAFVLSWALWVPAALASRDLLSFPVSPATARLVGVFGPSLAALVTAAIYGGGRGVRSLLGRLLVWRVGLRWYAFVLLWPAALSLITTALHVLLGGTAPDYSQPPFARVYPLPPELAATSPFVLLPFVFLQQTLAGSSLGEELGWRGFALPRLQGRWTALRASLILGGLWGLWHLPLYLTRGDAAGESWGWSLLGIVADAILFTWVYNNTRGSLLVALLFHSAIAVTGLFLSPSEAAPLLPVAVNWCAAALVIALAGPCHLSRAPAPRPPAVAPGVDLAFTVGNRSSNRQAGH